MQMVEIKPLKPFVGSYRCALSEADVIDDGLVENEGGVIVKERVPRKRYRGLVSTTRAATKEEVLLWKEGRLPGNLVMQTDEEGERHFVEVLPDQPTIRVPEDVAANLISRGLADRVSSVAPEGMRLTPQI